MGGSVMSQPERLDVTPVSVYDYLDMTSFLFTPNGRQDGRYTIHALPGSGSREPFCPRMSSLWGDRVDRSAVYSCSLSHISKSASPTHRRQKKKSRAFFLASIPSDIALTTESDDTMLSCAALSSHRSLRIYLKSHVEMKC